MEKGFFSSYNFYCFFEFSLHGNYLSDIKDAFIFLTVEIINS